MTNLPPIRDRQNKHVGRIFAFGGMEALAKALHYGDGFEDVEGLAEFGRRCRAVADLIDKRLDAAKGGER